MMLRFKQVFRSSFTWFWAASTISRRRSVAFEIGGSMSIIFSSLWTRPPPPYYHNTVCRMVSSSLHVQNESSNIMDGLDTESSLLWKDLLPFLDSSHNSVTITIPEKHDVDSDDNNLFDRNTFPSLLANTVDALRDLQKSSVWVEIPMSRASLIEDMEEIGFVFHHAQGKIAKLNMWLRQDIPSKIPEFATHHLGVGAVVINRNDEILCIRELRQNYMPWKVPTGLSERGETIAEAAEREVLEETGIRTRFHSILSFRHTHGMAHDRSDIFFVCRLIPIDEDGQIPTPIPQECEIAEAKWLPLSEYREMINGSNNLNGHPMMSFVMEHIFDKGGRIESREVKSVVPGRKATPMYFPSSGNILDS